MINISLPLVYEPIRQLSIEGLSEEDVHQDRPLLLVFLVDAC